MDIGLSGRHVLVTGASRGLGSAFAAAFAREGARVSAVARSEAGLAAVVDGMGGRDAGHYWTAADLSLGGQGAAAAERVARENGDVDVVIHNVGASLGLRDMFAPVDAWIEVWRLRHLGAQRRVN